MINSKITIFEQTFCELRIYLIRIFGQTCRNCLNSEYSSQRGTFLNILKSKTFLHIFLFKLHANHIHVPFLSHAPISLVQRKFSLFIDAIYLYVNYRPFPFPRRLKIPLQFGSYLIIYFNIFLKQ